MSLLELPRTLTLPSGLRVRLTRASGREGRIELRPEGEGEPLFSDALEVLAVDVRVDRLDGAPLEPDDLALGDFHLLRAALTKAGFLRDHELELDCYNCGELLVVEPCKSLELGPWLDGELDDPELDSTATFGDPIPIVPFVIDGVRADAVTFSPRTVGHARPLFEALRHDPIDVDEAFVLAMGISTLGPARDPAPIARALADAGDDTFESVTDAFLDSHYAPRLASDVTCPRCRATNTTIAPGLREFEMGHDLPPTNEDEGHDGGAPVPPLAEFVEIAHGIAEPLIAEIPGPKAVLVVEDGTPAVDDGGVPLLGSYVPPPPGDVPVPGATPTVTVYYQTFQALEREEGRYDWRTELTETIEHELEHHVYFLRGDDPMDEEEHAEIERERARIVGRGETRRRALAEFGQSLPEFWRRAWPLVLIGALVLAISMGEGYCGHAEP